MADVEEGAHPEDESIEADLLGPVAGVENQVEMEVDLAAVGIPEAEADQGQIGDGENVIDAPGQVSSDLDEDPFGGNRVAEAEADQSPGLELGLSSAEDENVRDASGQVSGEMNSDEDPIGGNGVAEAEADQSPGLELGLSSVEAENVRDASGHVSGEMNSDEDPVGGNGVAEAEADQSPGLELGPSLVEAENVRDASGQVSGEMNSDEDPAGGNGVAEAEADQSPGLEPRPSLVEADLNLEVPQAFEPSDFELGGNGVPEAEADQGPVCLPDEAPVTEGIEASCAEPEDYQTEDDQACLEMNSTESESQEVGDIPCPVQSNSVENLESFAGIEADLDSQGEVVLVEGGVGVVDNCDNSSTESGSKDKDIDVEDDTELNAEPESCDAELLGQVAAGSASPEYSASGDFESDSVGVEAVPEVVGGTQPSASGADVSFEPECDQGQSDNSAHSSQIFCDDQEVQADPDLDQPEDMGACAHPISNTHNNLGDILKSDNAESRAQYEQNSIPCQTYSSPDSDESQIISNEQLSHSCGVENQGNISENVLCSEPDVKSRLSAMLNLNDYTASTECVNCVSPDSSLESSGQKLGNSCEINDIKGDKDSPIKSATLSDLDSKEASECDDQLLSELDAMLDDGSSATSDAGQELPNGIRPEIPTMDMMEYKALKAKYENLVRRVESQEEQIKSQQEELEEKDSKIEEMTKKENELRQLASASSGHTTLSKNADDIYLAQIKELEYTIAQQQKEIKQGRDKLTSHDGAAKRAIASLQNELKLRLDQVTKMYQDCQREKDQMVMKFAQAEQKNLELQKTIDKAESRVRDHVKDREVLIGKLKGFSADKSKLSTQLQTKHAECNSVVKELDKYKDMVSSQEVKVKWAQNKLKAELDVHKETKGKLEKMTIRLKEAKEETEQIRKNCQEMIKTYQESEEIKSNSLDQQLKVKLSQLEQQQQEHKDKEEVHLIVIQELESLKRKQKDAVEEVKTLRDKVICLEQERQEQYKTMEQYKNILQTQKRENKDTILRLRDLENIEAEKEKTKEENRNLLVRLEDMQHMEKETQQEVKNCRNRETELLELTQKLTDKNAHLASENTALSSRCTAASNELEKLKKQCEGQQKKIAILSEELEEEKQMRHAEIDLLTNRLDEKSKAVDQLTTRVEEEKDENKTIKRRHTANLKDLTRQLQQARKRIETLEQAGDKDSLSQGSRTSSTNSLDTLNTNGQHSSSSTSSNSGAASRASSQEPAQADPAEPPTVRHIEPDKQMLIERIVKVQKALARKSEKIEFVEDHNQQLLEEIRKKTKIIQNYIVREESGVLAPESMDRVKAQLSKKGGIMASVYSSQPVDGGMTMDLSLEINRKLQAVLEDTLLKNITLKENLDTLGAEIARLSQENRTIQLKLKSPPNHST